MWDDNEDDDNNNNNNNNSNVILGTESPFQNKYWLMLFSFYPLGYFVFNDCAFDYFNMKAQHAIISLESISLLSKSQQIIEVPSANKLIDPKGKGRIVGIYLSDCSLMTRQGERSLPPCLRNCWFTDFTFTLGLRSLNTLYCYVLVTRHAVWISNRIYWTPITRNYR
jgi:hypothetical protein